MVLGNIQYKKVIAVFLSALFFGLVHYEWGWVGIVQTTFMGLVLAVSYATLKKGLIVVILAHIYMDTLLWLGIYFG